MLPDVSSENTGCCKGFTAVHTLVWSLPTVNLCKDIENLKSEPFWGDIYMLILTNPFSARIALVSQFQSKIILQVYSKGKPYDNFTAKRIYPKQLLNVT